MPVDYTTEARIAYLTWLATEDADEEDWVRTLRDYAAGQHPVYLTDRQEEFLGLKARDSNYPYAHNLCHLVIASVVERLRVTGFEALEEDADAEPDPAALAARAMDWWDGNRMDAGQDSLHEKALRDGEAYIVVHWPADAEAPQWSINQRFDGTQGVKLHRDPITGDPLFASKRWQEFDPMVPGKTADATRLTLYFPDRVERYRSVQPGKGGLSVTGKDGLSLEVNWEPYRGEDGTDPWPIWWTDTGEEGGEPLGLAVIAFENPGGSEINDLIPVQDMLNKSDLDLIGAADMAGFPILWVSGVQAQIDSSTGAEKIPDISPGHMLRMSDPAAKAGRIEAANLEGMIRICKYWIESAAGVTRTPQYLLEALGADQPSGESLKQREIGLIHKAERKQRVFGNAWEDVVTLSARLWNLYRGTEAVTLTRLQCQWEPVEVEDPKATAEAAKLWAETGVPEPMIWAEKYGFDQGQIDKALEMRKADEKRRANIGSALLQQFEQGGGGTENGE